jgi:hypothetical protein
LFLCPLGKINGRDRSPAEIDINPTNTLKTDRENINQKDDTNLINETSPNITNWFERTKKQNIDVSKPVSQMDTMGVLIDTNTNLAAENSSRRVREEKRLDRKSYKSPKRDFLLPNLCFNNVFAIVTSLLTFLCHIRLITFLNINGFFRSFVGFSGFSPFRV